MSEVKYKLKPGVLCCPTKRGIIYDHNKEYPADRWPEDEADQRVKDGFLVRVEAVREPKKIPVKV